MCVMAWANDCLAWWQAPTARPTAFGFTTRPALAGSARTARSGGSMATPRCSSADCALCCFSLCFSLSSTCSDTPLVSRVANLSLGNESSGPPLPAIATFIQLLPRGFKGAPYRFSDSTIFCAVEGAGHSRIGDTTLHWKQDDIFMAPSWMPVLHESVGDAVLFSASDRPLQQFLGIWREQVPLPA